MTVTYLETIQIVNSAGMKGVEYSKMSRAMKVHTRSLLTEGVVACFIGDEQVSLDTPKGVICLTNSDYVQLLVDAGLVVIEDEPKKPRKHKSTLWGPSTRTVPTPEESVTPIPTVAPEGSKVRFVPGGAVDHPVVVKITQEDRMSALEAQMSKLIEIFA